jgi:hypothetical protein
MQQTEKDMIDVGEREGAEVSLEQENNEQAKETQEENIEVSTEDSTESNNTSDQSTKESTESSTEQEDSVKKEKKDELDEYGEGVKKRIAKLTFKVREAERQREEAINFAKIQKQERDNLEKRFTTLDKSYVSEFENRVKTNMAAAKLALRNAIENQDIEGQVNAQEQIANLSVDMARLNATKSSQVIQQENFVQPQQVQQYEQVNTYNNTPIPNSIPTDEKAEEWASRNSWFGKDSAMTYTAIDLHKKLVNEEGFDPKSDEYYVEINKRIRLEFPHKFSKIEDNTAERVKPTQAVASAKRSAVTGRKKTVTLTPSQVAIARKLGVPLEEYAKQLKLTKEV